MRALHLYAGNLFGGIERSMITLFLERGHCSAMESHFGLCFEGQLSRELRSAGAPVHPLGNVRFSRPWTVWRARRCLAQLLRHEPFDAVVCHACWPHALFASVVRAAGARLIFWAHDLPAATHWLDRRAAATPPDLILANSAFTKAAMVRLFPNVPSEVFYSPVSLSAFPERNQVRQQVRAELQTPPAQVVIVMTSRLETWKGHTLLLAALGKLKATPGWECWIAGGPQRPREAAYLQSLKSSAAAEGIAPQVKFLGQRSDVPRLLVAADIHCQPNLGPEPFGIAFVEALQAGLPVVTTAMGAPPEFIKPTCGLLVRPDDPTELSIALQDLIIDGPRRTEMGAAGPSRARDLCDPAAQTQKLYCLLSRRVAAEVAA